MPLDDPVLAEEVIERQDYLQTLALMGLDLEDAEAIASIVESEFWPIFQKTLEGIQEFNRNQAFDGVEPLSENEYPKVFALSRAVDRIHDTLTGIALGYKEYLLTVKEIRESGEEDDNAW